MRESQGGFDHVGRFEEVRNGRLSLYGPSGREVLLSLLRRSKGRNQAGVRLRPPRVRSAKALACNEFQRMRQDKERFHLFPVLAHFYLL
jgi:hypothetical protein